MNLTAIKNLEKKALKEAEKAVKAIYKKYDKQMSALIAKQIPKGKKLISGNGIVLMEDENGETIRNGKAWGNAKDEQLDYLASLQYTNDIQGGFLINDKIKGTK